jgi:CTP synthase (UTP-ammonia lyase)
MLDSIKFFFSWLWDFIHPFISQMLSQIGPILAKAAMDAVIATEQNMTGATGADKRNDAYNAILASLESQGLKIGIDVSVSLINSALEMAVQKLQGVQTTVTAATAPVLAPNAPAASSATGPISIAE